MGFLDRFKKQKEQEVEKTASSSVVAENKVEEKPKTKKVVKKVEDKKEKVVKSVKNVVPEALSDILVCPLVTEKSATLASVGQYVFEINPRANRLQVAQAFKAVYGIAPVKVQIQNIRREPVRFGRFHGKQKSWKKAIVCLAKGKTINVHEGI
ncbi:MAG: 50S ribosomal protein L23 [Candidatus Uhrbacteria bacterium]